MLCLGPGSVCDVCLEPFGSDLKAPCSIDCGHVFCLEYVRPIAIYNPQLNIPFSDVLTTYLELYVLFVVPHSLWVTTSGSMSMSILQRVLHPIPTPPLMLQPSRKVAGYKKPSLPLQIKALQKLGFASS